MGTDEKVAKRMEHCETDDLKVRIEKLRAKGKTYREIAKQERVSIAQISRILKQPTVGEAGVKPQTSSVDSDGEEAAAVFELLEKGKSLPKIVIDRKMSPHEARQLHEEWVGLKEIDVNQPIVLKQIKQLQKLLAHEIVLSLPLRQLFKQAGDIGGFRLKNCSYVNSKGFCTNWYWNSEDGSKYHKQADALRCAFCFDFKDNRVAS